MGGIPCRRVGGFTGVEGSKQVLSAKQAEERATDGVASAEGALQRARQAVVAAQVKGAEQVAKAEEAVATAQRAQVDQQRTGLLSIAKADEAVGTAQRAQVDQARTSAASIAAAHQSVENAERSLATAYAQTSTAGAATANTLAQAFAKLTPAGAEFARFIYGLKDELGALSKAAQDGLLPGLQAGIQTLLPYLPGLTTFVSNLAKVMGDLFVQASKALTGPFWTQFFNFLGGNAGGWLTTFATTFGNIVTGAAALFQALSPLGDLLNGAIAVGAQKFAEWAKSLSASSGFQTFIGYIVANLPMVGQLFYDLGRAVTNIIIALAPFGPLALEILDFALKFIAGLDPKLLGPIVVGVGALMTAFSGVGAAIGPVVAVLGFLAMPLGLVVIGVAALVAGVTYAYFHFAEFRRIVDQAWQGILDATRPVVEFFTTRVVPAVQGIIDAVRGFVDVALPIVVQFADGMRARIEPLMPQVKAIFGTIGDIIVGALDFIKGVIELATKAIAFIWNTFGDNIMNFIGVVFNVIVTIVQNALELVKNIIKTATALIHGDWAGVWDGIRTIVSNAWDVITAIIGGALNIVGSILSNAWDIIKRGASTLWDNVSSSIFQSWESIKSTVWNGLKDIGKSLSDSWDSIKMTTGQAWDSFASSIYQSWESTKSTVWNGLLDVKKNLSEAWESIKTSTGTAWDSITGKVSGAWNGIAEAVKTPINAIIDVIDSLIEKVNVVLPDGIKIPTIQHLAAGGPVGPGLHSFGGKQYAGGGQIFGEGGPTDDRVPIMASPGEWVIRAGAANKLGPQMMQAINWADHHGGDVAGDIATAVVNSTGRVNFATGGEIPSAGRTIPDVQNWIRGQVGKPYVWGATGPNGFDCSGLTGAVYGMLLGLPNAGNGPRYFTTLSDFGALGFKPGTGAYTIGVNPTHMVGNLGGLGFEARSTATGLFFGPSAKDVTSFPNQYYLPQAGGAFVGSGAGAGGSSGAGGGNILSAAVKALYDAGVGPVKGAVNDLSAPFGLPGKVAGGLFTSAVDGMIQPVLSALGAGGGNVPSSAIPPGSGVDRWSSLVLQMLALEGQPASLLGQTLRRMNQESGGDPNAINNWDSNARAGIPSKGLMQVIDPTFASYRDPSLSGNIFDPAANIAASMRYATGHYGSLAAAYDRAGGYADGGLVKPLLFDGGGYLPQGVSVVQNNTGAPEPLRRADSASVEQHFHISQTDPYLIAAESSRRMLMGV